MRLFRSPSELPRLFVLVLGGALIAPNVPAQEEWEWEADEGYTREEWYDPTDWFDGPGVDYENDWWEPDFYDYDNYYDGYYDPYYDAYYDPYYSPYYDPYYDTGFYDEYYDYDPYYEDWDYPDRSGETNWTWDSQRNEWVRQNQNQRQNQRQNRQGQRNNQDQRAQQNRRNQQRMRQQGQQQRGQQQRGQQQTAQFSGTLEDFHTINLKLVKLRMQDGSTRIIALDPRFDVSRMNLQAGEQVMVRGNATRIGNSRVLMAQQIRADGQTFRMGQQNRSQQNRSQQQQRNRQLASIRGRLESWTEAQVGGNRNHTFVRLRLQDGKSRIIDLGPNATISDLDLNQGDEVAVRGPIRTLSGKQVVLAQTMRVSGEPVGLEWQPRNATSTRRQQGQQDQTASSASVQGKIESINTLTLTDESGTQREVARIELQDGTSHLVCFRPDVSLSSVEEGTTLRIKGKRKQMDGRQVVVVDRASVGGTTIQSPEFMYGGQSGSEASPSRE